VTISRTYRVGGLAVAAALAVAACGNGSGATTAPTTGSGATTPAATTAASIGAALSGTVTIDGSSTVYPITALAAEEFQAANSGVQVPVAFSGTGGGFKKLCAGETDINDASRPIKADDEGEGKACATNNIEYVELQVAIDGLTVVVNSANTFATCLTLAELKTIYGKDAPAGLTWSDVRAGFPADEVERFMPGADSGTFDYFTEEVNGVVDEATTYATQSEDDNTLVTGVAGDANAIGFFGYAYYNENRDKLKAVEIDGGSGCVEPTEATINDGTDTPLSRPLFIYPNEGEARTRPELKAFIDYYLANATTFATDPTIGYVAAPDPVLADSVAKWTAAVGG
jgi:phosphate transport system substrate-binding protein